MTLSVDADRPADHDRPQGFAVSTARCDSVRADLEVSGRLGADGAHVLAEVLDGHIRAGRRYLRLDVAGLQSLGAAALAVIAAAHDRLLAGRGTLVLTGVGDQVEAMLRRARPASPLLMLRPTAAQLRH